MHEGVPAGGVLVPELAANANRALGNSDATPLLEVFGALTLAALDQSLSVATEDGMARTLVPGESLDVPTSRLFRVRYVAVGGGLSVEERLGGRGTLLVAGLGGHEGRALRRGDRIAVVEGATARPPAGSTGSSLHLSSAIRVVRGPDVARFASDALSVLTRESFVVLEASDRTGARLGGPRLARKDEDSGRSAPMVRGAIQVPSSGAPIVLGPDHPTTGGYPVLAVVAHADVGLFFARPVGTPVRFEL
jgi:5-oxoprolinase (ATP-hydrolysing) subunit C